mmetsp:Transcript_14892/g.25440  ORF Transcript_14892/g.25440 Transcript_14892/m.25440 type:complete len:169 (+) Transcript_14892:304-810(+)
MANAARAYAAAAAASKNDPEAEPPEDAADRLELLERARQRWKRDRVAALARFDDAVFTPGEALAPDALALKLASDIVDATIVLTSVSLVTTCRRSASDLLADVDGGALGEVDRLAVRIGRATNETLTGPAPVLSWDVATEWKGGRGPFSDAVARAHSRLDGVGVPTTK